jgi:hypothetical protein
MRHVPTRSYRFTSHRLVVMNMKLQDNYTEDRYYIVSNVQKPLLFSARESSAVAVNTEEHTHQQEKAAPSGVVGLDEIRMQQQNEKPGAGRRKSDSS